MRLISRWILHSSLLVLDPPGADRRRKGRKDADGPRSARAARKEKQQVVKIGDMEVGRGADGMFGCGLCLKRYESPYSLQVCLRYLSIISCNTFNSDITRRRMTYVLHRLCRVFLKHSRPRLKSARNPRSLGPPGLGHLHHASPARPRHAPIRLLVCSLLLASPVSGRRQVHPGRSRPMLRQRGFLDHSQGFHRAR